MKECGVMAVTLRSRLAWIWFLPTSVLGVLDLCIYFPSSINWGHASQRFEEQMIQGSLAAQYGELLEAVWEPEARLKG